ncbi:MAG: methionyl-tRNA formyltransferase [Gammaproteobacteria bacterium]|nr:methionyl-tRNA formyltransferase [Gammaproteobacteria bacterium]|tara:strand:- start:370 stop:1347 length:978 start_codon:yes stop_codon:yes gene_type:complete
MTPLKICFAGTPSFAAEHLAALIAAKHNIVAVYTQPDRPSGRGKKLQPSPVKQVALDSGLIIKQPKSLKLADAQQELAAFSPDLLIVVAYGLILPQEILDIPRLGCINVHASLLPRWRGAAPIERAILAGDKESGITIMKMDAGLDTGPMLYKSKVKISPDDDREILMGNLCSAGTSALLHTLDNFTTLRESAQLQDDTLSTYAAKIDKSESLLQWQLPAEQLCRVVKAGVGRVPAYSFIEGERLRILKARPLEKSQLDVDKNVLAGTILGINSTGVEVSCSGSSLLVSKVQLAGKKPWSIRDLINSGTTIVETGKHFDNGDING